MTLNETYAQIGKKAIALIRVGALDFAAIGSTIGRGKTKNCTKGFSCGYACIGQGKKCRNPLAGQSKTYADFLATQAKTAIAPAPKPVEKPVEKPAPKPTAKPVEKRSAPKLPEGTEITDLSPVKTYSIGEGKSRIDLVITSIRDKKIPGDADIVFLVGEKKGGTYNKGTLKGKEANRAAIRVLKMAQYDISKRPDGYIYRTSAHKDDGFAADRARVYESFGFSKPATPGDKQYGIVRGGKLYPYTPPS